MKTIKNMIENSEKTKSLLKEKYTVIECGSGGKKIVADSIAIDVLGIDGVDIVADLNHGFPMFDNDSVDEIVSFHFLEHLNDLEFFFKESYRVLKNGGKFWGTVPHFSNPYYYSDYTHNRPFGIYSFSYFSKTDYYVRKVPTFYNDLDFKINNIDIILHSPFYFRSLHRRAMQRIVNASKWTQEFYEENLCFMFPAFEIKYELTK